VGEIVQLRAVMDAIDIPEEWEALLDPRTGEILVMTDEEREILEEEEVGGEEALEMPEWERAAVGKLRKLIDSGRALALPDKFDFHEWDVMKRFATLVEDPDQSIELLNAIHGTGAFRMFKAAVARLGLREKWFEFRDEALREMAKDWLDENGIEYTEGGGRPAASV
jgi:Uncharacterised protein family (UPF0158)